MAEDKWEMVSIGGSIPENSVQVDGEQNMYVALCYKHGKPVCGRAWSNEGVVDCSFPYAGKEITGKMVLCGEIEILTYKGLFEDNGYRYEWIPFKDRKQAHLTMLRSGTVTPVLIKSKEGGVLVGNLDLNSEIASCSWKGKEEKMVGPPVQDLLVICQNNNPPSEKVAETEGWVDVCVNDPYPPTVLQAAGRRLKMEDGSSTDHCPALWYKDGEPVLGCGWNNDGKMAASFGAEGKEFAGEVESFQVLLSSDPALGWVTYREATSWDENWKLVAVKGLVPCVITTPEGFERLGQIDLTKEVVTCGWAGVEETYTGSAVQEFLVLVRKG